MSSAPRTLQRLGRRAITSLLILAVLATAALTLGVLTRRFQAVPVLTGSMAPAIEAGAIAFAWNTPTDDLEVGDVIVYRAPTSSRPVIVHRIVALRDRAGDTAVVTRGDANEDTDTWGEMSLRGGRTWTVTGSLAGVGRVVIWARSPAAQIAAFVALVLGCALLLSDRRVRRRLAAHRRAHRRVEPTPSTSAGDDTPAPPAPKVIRPAPVLAAIPTTPTPASRPPTSVPTRVSTSLPSPPAAVVPPAAPAGGSIRHAEVARRISALDPAWSWRPALHADLATLVAGPIGGGPGEFWLELRAGGASHLGVASLEEPRSGLDPVQHAVTSALIHAAANLGIGVEGAPPAARETATSRSAADRPVRVTRRGVGVLAMLALAVIGPSASAAFTDTEMDTHRVSTGSLAPPPDVSATVGFALGSCEVDVRWSRTPTATADGYEVLRQPLEAGVGELDGLGVTTPEPAGPFEVVASVDGVDTLSTADALPDDAVQAATRYRYAVRTIRGQWRSALSPTADVDALGVCATAPTSPAALSAATSTSWSSPTSPTSPA